uniref:Uncharacterized protein n=1 Tax=Leersia perrieri TaxID=77586 RepID=A0A0D9W6B4_9ORYZ
EVSGSFFAKVLNPQFLYSRLGTLPVPSISAARLLLLLLLRHHLPHEPPLRCALRLRRRRSRAVWIGGARRVCHQHYLSQLNAPCCVNYY